MSVLSRRRGRRWRRGIARNLRRNLIAGSLLLIPVALTYLVVRFIFDLVDGVLRPAIQWAFQRAGLDWTIPGLGVVAMVILVYVAGLALANALGRQMLRWSQEALLRVPLIGTLYSAAKKLVESFSGTGETGFKRVVMIEYPRSGAWTIGFLTGITSTSIGAMAVIYIPTAPTPNTGWVAIVPVEQVLDTDLTVQTAIQLTFSGGILSPATIKIRKLELTAALIGPAPKTPAEDHE